MPEGLLVLTLVLPWGFILGGAYQFWKMRRRLTEDRRDLAAVWRAFHAVHVAAKLPPSNHCPICRARRAHEERES